MSAESPEDPFAEFKGYTEWPVSESSVEGIEYVEPEPVAGRVVRCWECSWRGVDSGYWTHYRREHTGREH